MIKATEDQLKAYKSIQKAFEESRGSIEPLSMAELIIFMLMWAKFIPQTEGETIGYFDVLSSIDSSEKFISVKAKITKETGIDMTSLWKNELGIFIHDQLNLENGKVESSSGFNGLDSLKISLIPAAKLIANGEKEDIDSIIMFFKTVVVNSFGRRVGEFSINQGILDFSNMVFDEVSNKNNGLNCLYPAGSASSYYFAKERDVFLFDHSITSQVFNKGLISLYGKPLKFKKFSSQQQEVTFAAPPFGLRPNTPTSGTNFPLPFNESKDSEAIRDPHCKMMYLAHENTKNLTILVTALGTLFSKVNGTNYFRKKIIENNWLDTVIKCPSGIFAASQVPAVLLILKKDRKKEDEVQFIDFSDCKNKSSSRINLDIPKEEINKLFTLYKNKKENKISRLVPKLQIKINDYQLNLHKYIFSDEQEAISRILQKRKTIKLSSLVSFVRPLHIESKKAKNGPEINEIMLSDINSMGEIIDTNKKVNVREDFFSKTNFPFIQKGDLVISIKGTLGKIGYIPNELINTVPGPSLCILRLNDSAPIKGEYLFQYLLSNIGQKMFISASQGGSIPFIAIDDLKNFPIPIPTLEEQKVANKNLKRSKELSESLQRMQKELDECTANGWLQVNKAKESKDDSS